MHPLIQTIVPTVLVPSAACGLSVLAASLLPPGRWRGALVGARCTSDAKVNASGMQGFERRDVFSNDEWGMVGQHDPARSNPNALR